MSTAGGAARTAGRRRRHGAGAVLRCAACGVLAAVTICVAPAAKGNATAPPGTGVVPAAEGDATAPPGTGVVPPVACPESGASSTANRAESASRRPPASPPLACSGSDGAGRSRVGVKQAVDSGCAEAFQRLLDQVVTRPLEHRLQAILVGLAEVCPPVLRELAAAAAATRTRERAERAAILGAAAGAVLPPACACAPGEMATPAFALARRCPPPAGVMLAKPLLEIVDSGTYLFFVATHARLRDGGALGAASQRLLDNFILAAALQAESSGNSAR
ncbi:MAG: hypothetical protein HYV63_05370 [Candidatus Schekmanbacteria bacterium]|nr:hypothetical protein [Candidatus Schekmanbacteria bacterium]